MDKNVPEIRFKGFKEAWNNSMAADIADYTKGKGYSKNDLTKKGTPIILYGSLYTNYQFEISEINTFATSKKESIYSQGNEVIIPASGETSEDIARASAVLTSGVLLGGDLNIIKPFNFINSSFLALTVSNGKAQKELSRNAQGKTVVHIHNEDIQKLSISYPSKPEQVQIVSIFRNVEALITLQRRKLNNLTTLKKSCLDKMFPKDGSLVPELRFAGFTEPWKKTRLGNIGKAQSGIGFPDSEQGGSEGIPFFKVSDMNIVGNENEMVIANNYVTPTQIEKNNWNPINELPAIFFAKVGAAVLLNRKRLCLFPFLLDNNTMAYSLDNKKWNKDFAKVLFDTINLPSLVQVGALPSYNAGDIEAIEVNLPPSMLEQIQIGSFFRNLDNLVVLHQQKLDKLRNLKKAFLDKMFV